MLPGLSAPPDDYRISLDFKASTNNVNVSTLIGSPVRPVDVHIQIRTGVVIGAALKTPITTYFSPDAAFAISLPSGSRVYLLNRGRIAGGGGIGGTGQRGRSDGNSASGTIGGGGGGGAGSTSQGGSESLVDIDPGNNATDGVAGTTTTGGAAGQNDTAGNPSGGYDYGARPQYGGTAISVDHGVSLWIENEDGEIWAGANGGREGYQDGPLQGGSVQPLAGDDLAPDVTVTSGSLNLFPKAVDWRLTSGLVWISGDAYPNVRGYVSRRPT